GRMQSTRDLLLSVFQKQNDVPAADLYRVVWRSQGLVAHSMTARRRLYLESPAAQADLQQLSGLRKRLAEIYWAQTPSGSGDTLRRELERLNLAKEELERQLARESKTYQRLREIDEADFVALAKKLPKNVAVVQILQSRNATEKPKDRYLAFVLRASEGEPGFNVVCKPLGPAEPIDE